MCATLMASFLFAQTVSTFENLLLPIDSFWNGSDLSGGFASGNAYFTNNHSGGLWSGFSYSNKTDSTTSGTGNQYSVITASGFSGSDNYAVATTYGEAKIRLLGSASGRTVTGFYLTNSTYAYLSMKNGDAFAKKFGGASGTDPDWFRLTVNGWSNGVMKTQSVEFYLADFRSPDSTQDYIVRDWRWVNLQPLGSVDSLIFSLESTDTVGGFGMNNPAYFVIDNFTTAENIPVKVSGGFEELTLPVDTFWNGSEFSGGFTSDNAHFGNNNNGAFWSGFSYSNKKDSTTAGVGNQYSAITANGYNGSNNYSVANTYGDARIRLNGGAKGKTVEGFYVTNATYAYLSMKNGDAFAKKFGGVNSTDPDWYMMRIVGWLNGALKAQSVDFYLADFRSTNSADDYIVRDWRWVDLKPLGDVDSIEFLLSSTDTAGGFGMNNPAYFAIDNFTAYTEPRANNDYVTTTYLNDTVVRVLNNDGGLFSDPFSVDLIGSPLIPGATATVVSNDIYYTPSVGIVAVDTLAYRVCDNLGACDTAQVVVNVTGVTAVKEFANDELQFTVYPNPFSGNEIRIVTTEDNIGSELTVYDLSGKVMSTEKIESQFSILNADCFASGIYFIRLNSLKGTSVRKIVKQ